MFFVVVDTVKNRIDTLEDNGIILYGHTRNVRRINQNTSKEFRLVK